VNEDLPSQDPIHRCGFVALSGLTNAGKSTLLNVILGQEIALVTPKPQTTRNRIVGVLTRPGAQLVFVDTPGIHRGRRELDRRMARGAQQAVEEADVVVRVVDASKVTPERLKGRIDLRPTGKPTVVVLNKVDLVHPKQLLLPLLETCGQIEGVEAVVPLSALRHKGIEALIEEVARLLPEGPALYPEDMVTDRPERFIAAELIRGAVLRLTHQEVPHASAANISVWYESPKGVHLEARIVIERPSQRAILLGKGGSMIRQIGETARGDIGKLLDCPVHLKLTIEVSEHWRGDPRTLDELGYDE
jgi:GTP-binding protein Era